MKKNALYLALRWGSALIVTAALAMLPDSLSAQGQQPTITITEVPPLAPGGPDEMFPISGEVTGVDSKDCRVVIYVLAGGTWFVQPYDYSGLTAIQSGKWEAETHGGSIYAALIVPAKYKAKAQLKTLPAVDGKDVLARVRVPGKPPREK